MLAPLKNRALLERDDGDPQHDLPPADPAAGRAPELSRLADDNTALKLALRQSRQSHKRSATLAARQIVAQTNEINRLTALNAQLQQRLADYESGQAIVSLGQQLMSLAESNEQLRAEAHRVWVLDKSLRAAHRECERLARERDTAISGLGTIGCARYN